MSLSVVILAAGQGTRMRSRSPKVLQPLAGKPLLGHVLNLAETIGAEDVCVVYGHGGEQVQSAFADAAVRWALQEEQLGTGHAVQQAMPEIPDDNRVLVLAGDVPLLTAETIRNLLFESRDAALAVLTVDMADPTGYGRIIRNDDTVTAIVEQKDASAEQRAIREVNTGVMVFRAGDLKRWIGNLDNDNAQGEYYLTDVIAMAVAESTTVLGVKAADESEVLGINDKRQLAHVERLYQRRKADELMIAGATLLDPSRVDVRGDVHCGTDVTIDANVIFEGEVTLGDDVTVESNCLIRDSHIGAGTIIHANSYIENTTTGVHCIIGPFARLRPGNELADNVKIGNFVEVKKSRIGDGSKVNHLSYVGDAEIGRSVNIGAGTITCNYDGANKHKTTIGDGAFIGSGVELVAPVEIGEGATIGAGATISKNAPEHQLTIERARQTTIKGWKRPVKNA